MSQRLHAGMIERAMPRAVTPNPILRPVPDPVEGPEGPMNEVDLPDVVTRVTPLHGAQPKDPKRELSSTGSRLRISLTVRVSPETRAMLERMRQEKGQTFQNILHEAVTRHLDRVSHLQAV